MTCKACARSIRGLGEGPAIGCRGCDSRSIARSSAMLTAMDPTKPDEERKAWGEVLQDQLQAFARQHMTTYQQAKAEVMEWWKCDQLNRGEQPQESTT